MSKKLWIPKNVRRAFKQKDGIEIRCKKVWARWEKGELSHSQVQRELDLILGETPKGFFVKLGTNLKDLVFAKIPIEYRQTYTYEEISSKRDEIRSKIIEKTNWSSFWQFHKDMITAPSDKELKHLKTMSNYELIDYFKLICISLKQLTNNNLEHSKEARILHAYYLLLKKEINSRPKMPKLPKTDAFLEYIQHKQHYKEQLEMFENARLSGNMCPYCRGTDVRSYGKAEWKCHDCGKRFRKH